jgi:hypothetical protein
MRFSEQRTEAPLYPTGRRNATAAAQFCTNVHRHRIPQGRAPPRSRPEDETEIPSVRTLLPMLERWAGRIRVNGWPTSLEVTKDFTKGGNPDVSRCI